MHFKQIKSLRVFIFLLLTVFLTNTVYASTMMSAAQLPVNNSAIEHHSSDVDHAAHNQKHKAQHSTDGQCTENNHCMACFSFLSSGELNQLNSPDEEVAILLLKPSYLSHISTQPQRPPIS